MIYDLYFHRDFDGVASAAVMLAFLRSRGDRVANFFPVDFYLIEDWKRPDFFRKNRYFGGSKNAPVVVDFAYHPEAKFWFDHHPTSFRRALWQKNFKPSKYCSFDSSYLSCCRLVLDTVTKKFGFKPNAHLKELAGWLDVIDSARYGSARQTIEMREPAIQIGAVIDYMGAKNMPFEKIINDLSQYSLKNIATQKDVAIAALRLRKEAKQTLLYYKKNTKIIGATAFTEESGIKTGVQRFAPFYLYPKILYSVRMRKTKSSNVMYKISASINPWKKMRDHVDIGKLLQLYGGGGHAQVGAVEVNEKRKATQIKNEIISIFNNYENSIRSK